VINVIGLILKKVLDVSNDQSDSKTRNLFDREIHNLQSNN
jgi:hypothetical protein